VVKTTADLDYDETETKTQNYAADPAVPPLTESTTRETYEGAGGTTGGVLGPDNIQVPNGGNGDGEYESTTAQRKNAVGLVTETRKAAPGGVRKLNVAVLLDAKTAAGIDMAQVQQMVSAAVGLNDARGDTIAVTALPFDESAVDAAAKAKAEAGAVDRRAQLISMAKIGAMVLAILILIFMAWRASRKAKRSKLSPEELAELAEMQAALEGADALALEGSAAALALEAGPSVDESALEREERAKEISEMVSNQPDEVAQLLRGWLADRRS